MFCSTCTLLHGSLNQQAVNINFALLVMKSLQLEDSPLARMRSCFGLTVASKIITPGNVFVVEITCNCVLGPYYFVRPVLCRTGFFSRIFIFGRRIFSRIFSPHFCGGKSVPRKSSRKIPAKSSKIYTTKIPDTFLQGLSGPVLRDTARLSQRYPPIARYGVFGVSTWPIGCDTPSPF